MIPIRFKMDWIQNTTQTNEVQKKTFFFKAIGEGLASPVVELSCPKSN